MCCTCLRWQTKDTQCFTSCILKADFALVTAQAWFCCVGGSQMSGFSSMPPGPNMYPNNQNNQFQPGAQMPPGANAAGAYNYANQPRA